MIADVSDGYWIFYEGPTYGKPDHEAYWHWFSRANHAIADGQFAFQHEPRETPDPIETTAVECRTAKPQVAVYGMKPRMHSLIDQTGRFEVHEFRGASPEYLANFDVLILQNFNVSLDESHPFLEALRNYVNRGGGVLFAHDTVWFMDSPFPAIAERAVPQHDTSVEAGRHVVDVDLVIDTKHPATASLEESTRFVPEFRDHMIFASGPEGAILIRNALGDAACVIGQHGNGRVVFSGSYYGYSRDLQGHERSVFLAILDWLAAQ